MTRGQIGIDTIGASLKSVAVHAMLIREPVVEKPKNPIKHAAYENECREALKPHLDAILELAVKAGWDRNIASYSLMYLAAKTARPGERSAA